jgi:hypothetical protein
LDDAWRSQQAYCATAYVDELDERRLGTPLRKKGAMVPALTAVGKGVSAMDAIGGRPYALIWCHFV